MITIKDTVARKKMEKAGALLADLFLTLGNQIKAGCSTLDLDSYIAQQLKARNFVSQTLGYKGYRHSSCISLNDEVVHGVPSECKILKEGDLVKVDICAAHDGYCADMTRCYFVGTPRGESVRLVEVANKALDKGIEKMVPGGRLGDISAAIQAVVESNGFGVVRAFAGHGIGKKMHEEPEILNYGKAGQGLELRPGMVFALEPMITHGRYDVFIMPDGWTAKTVDGSLAAHVEDTVLVTEDGPQILTRMA